MPRFEAGGTPDPCQGAQVAGVSYTIFIPFTSEHRSEVAFVAWVYPSSEARARDWDVSTEGTATPNAIRCAGRELSFIGKGNLVVGLPSTLSDHIAERISDALRRLGAPIPGSPDAARPWTPRDVAVATEKAGFLYFGAGDSGVSCTQSSAGSGQLGWDVLIGLLAPSGQVATTVPIILYVYPDAAGRDVDWQVAEDGLARSSECPPGYGFELAVAIDNVVIALSSPNQADYLDVLVKIGRELSAATPRE